MPHDAPASKVAATRGYGGEVITYDRKTGNREELGRRLAKERGMTLIPPYDHPHVIAGEGTAAKELIEEVGHLEMLPVCLGGGLLSGCALSARALNPMTVIGVVPEAETTGSNRFEKERSSASRYPTPSPTGPRRPTGATLSRSSRSS